jgi:predicted metalloprotease with PDZ domain
MPDLVTTPRRSSTAWRCPQPATHEFEVEMRVPALPDRDTAEIVFPTWAPGSYLVRDFVRHVIGLTSPTRAAGRSRASGSTSSAGGSDRRAPVSRALPVFAFEASVRTSFLDDSHGYWNGTSMFFHVAGELARPCRVTVRPPARSGWRVATALPRRRAAATRPPTSTIWSTRRSRSGTHETRAFAVGRTKFELALYGRCNADSARLVDILRRIVVATGRCSAASLRPLPVHRARAARRLGRPRAPRLCDDGHRGLSFEDEPATGASPISPRTSSFHAWNVKRIHDAALDRVDYTRENYTRLLWLFEGFTDYLAHIIMLRAGVTRDRDFYRMLAEDWPKYAARPGRNETPLDELSYEAWIKQYKPSENFINRSVSYYERGFWAGMALDIELRLATAGRRGLPEMFRRLWERFGRRGRPVDEADVRDAAAAVGGRRFDRFFDRAIRGTDELNLPALWRRAGLEVKARPEWDDGAAARRSRPRARAARARAGPESTCTPSGRWSATSSPIRPPGAPGSPSTTTSSPSTARA